MTSLIPLLQHYFYWSGCKHVRKKVMSAWEIKESYCPLQMKYALEGWKEEDSRFYFWWRPRSLWELKKKTPTAETHKCHPPVSHNIRIQGTRDCQGRWEDSRQVGKSCVLRATHCCVPEGLCSLGMPLVTCSKGGTTIAGCQRQQSCDLKKRAPH